MCQMRISLTGREARTAALQVGRAGVCEHVKRYATDIWALRDRSEARIPERSFWV